MLPDVWLKAAGVVFAILLLSLCAFGFNLLTLRRFNYRFFTVKMFLLLTLSLALWVGGVAVRIKGGDVPG